MTHHPNTDEYDYWDDFWKSYWLAYAEIRKAKIASGEIKPPPPVQASLEGMG